MNRLMLLTVTLLTLAGCGADGMPMASTASPEPGITITGDARMGVVTEL